MRTGGFPCRLIGCTESFQVRDQKSMVSLQQASAARTDHEVASHDYHHVRLPDEQPFSPTRRTTPKPTERR
jgi:hypothetical protein